MVGAGTLGFTDEQGALFTAPELRISLGPLHAPARGLRQLNAAGPDSRAAPPQLGLHARCLDELKARDLYDDFLIVATADHGEAFKERHGDILESGHGRYLYDSTQHVPLIVKLPGNRHAGERVAGVVQTIDIAPSILSELRLPQPASFRGLSLFAPLEGGEGREHVAYLEARGQTRELPGVGVAAIPQRRYIAMRNHDRKYIFDIVEGRHEVYDTRLDPEESRNLAPEIDPAELDLLLGQVVDTLGEAQSSSPSVVDPRVTEQLRALGYLE